MNALVRDRVDAISQALDTALRTYWPEEKRLSGANIAVLLRQATPTGSEIAIANGAASFDYKIQVAGPNNLLDSLPLKTQGEKRVLTVTFNGALGENVQDGGAGDAAPSTNTGDSIDLSWAPAPRSADAFPMYRELFEDGLDIYIQVGGDHNTPANDLVEAEAIFDELVRMGLKGVQSFKSLSLDSPPMEGKIAAFGSSVAIRVKLVHASMAPDDHLERLNDAYKANAKTADVVIYKGHAGLRSSYNGLVMHYNPRVAITMDEFKALELPSKQQIFLYDGCETYSGYADKLYEHPNKTPNNTDIITTGNYSTLHRAETTRSLLRSLTETVNGQFRPLSWDAIIKRMNASNASKWSPIYGVHGLDDNPKISPLADPSKIGASCNTAGDCGALDSLCLKTSSGSVCGAACSDTSACTNGYVCTQINSQSFPDLSECVPPQK